MSLEGKVYLVTGASSGIGAELSIQLAKEGASLALVGRNAEKFEKVVNRIKDEGVDDEPLVILADVSTDAERIVTKTIEKFGKIDVLINNAGFAIPASIETVQLDDYDKIQATNIRGTLHLTQLAIPYLEESKGNIVNVSSVCGLRPFIGFLSYCMSKAAMDQFTRCVSIELAPKGIRVNSVNPGVIDTEFHETAGHVDDGEQTILEKFTHMHPIGRVGTANEVVKAIMFLSDDRTASFVTGVCMPIDGGLVVKSAQ